VTYNEEKRDELVKGLREMADVIEAMPEELGIPYSTDIYMNVTVNTVDDEGNTVLDIEATRKNLAKAVKWLRNVEKRQDDNYYNVDRNFGRCKINVYADRSSVCKRVKTGVKFIPAKQVDEYEYQCEKISFLGMED
jgi:hypothetical protein